MRELKILAVVVVLTLITYWGVEPFAHSQMHPQVDPVNYNFEEADRATSKEAVEKATKALAEAEKKADEKAIKGAKTDLEAAQTFEKTINEFWDANKEAIAATPNVANGEALVTANCTACHSIESKGFPKIMDDATAAGAYGVSTPDLGSSGKIYSKEYLVAFIKNPALGSKVSHKFTDGRVHPMPAYELMNTPQEIADMVAYLQSIAPKEMTNKEVFVDACQRCHGLKYADMQKKNYGCFLTS